MKVLSLRLINLDHASAYDSDITYPWVVLRTLLLLCCYIYLPIKRDI